MKSKKDIMNLGSKLNSLKALTLDVINGMIEPDQPRNKSETKGKKSKGGY